ncbi:hypothetical protein HIM_12331 [Hirsutella minnesotensis 3608]|uniref:Thioesterase domain-containing protein n=1 Tax=Hirsutella minnesotensis 3608 TaxID=1043627 RepID=A0A0F8A081_9HYPO|nr:hypothetical protein HIM_12331 [Hirsutella minnesotensis 3608]
MSSEKIDLIQPEDWSRPASYSGLSLPVFLIHDVTGTTSAYARVNHMNRFVYGISNPEFWRGEQFAGGFPQLCRLYAGWIRDTVSKMDFPSPTNPDGMKDVLLAGWSLGGLLSFHIARELAKDPKIAVAGILLIDGPYPGVVDCFTTIQPLNASKQGGGVMSQMASQNNRTETHKIDKWALPTWTSELDGKRPKMILLRAKERVPGPDPDLSLVDLHRDDKMLGWDQYSSDVFEEVIDVEGNHFSLFANDNISEISHAMRRALEKLDSSLEWN